jgi:N-acetylglutamate synthase-like GNAT family acetyltransferase
METDRFVVAEDDGRIVGFGALDIGKANVTSVFVDPRYARAGIGSRILAALEGIARRAGLASVGLQAAGNAVDFYNKAGYQAKTADAAQPEWAEMRKELS